MIVLAGEVVPTPPGTPTWIVVLGAVLGAVTAGGGVGAVVVKFMDRRRTKIDADEVFTKVAVTLVEPLRDRLEQTEKLLRDEQARSAQRIAEADRQLDELRKRTRAALEEADQAYQAAHRLRRIMQQWHRAIMSPAATLEWLRTLVGPDEPAI